MLILIRIFLLCDILLVISTIWAAVYFHTYHNKVKKIPPVDNSDIRLFILLPALKEQKIVKETLDHFSRIENEHLTIMVVTSEKEENENKINHTQIRTTSQCVEEYIVQNSQNRIKHIHCPYIKGTKSTQLNYAVEQIKGSLSTQERQKSYIGVYDFDSKPALTVIRELDKIAASQNYPEIVQQVPINLKNITEVVREGNFMMLLHIFQSMIRTVGIELATLLLYTLNIHLPSYCMGAGMYVRLDTLIENGSFPEPVDDLTLGYRLYVRGARFTVLPSYNYVEVPKTVKAVINQDRLIFTGVLSGLTELKSPAKLHRKVFMFFSVLHNILIRTVLPWLYLLYIIVTVCFDGINPECVMLIVMPFIMTAAGAFAAAGAEEDAKGVAGKPVFFKALLCSWLWRPIRTIGPFRILHSLLGGKKITYKKTER